LCLSVSGLIEDDVPPLEGWMWLMLLLPAVGLAFGGCFLQQLLRGREVRFGRKG
jgi:hypothetical protein